MRSASDRSGLGAIASAKSAGASAKSAAAGRALPPPNQPPPRAPYPCTRPRPTRPTSHSPDHGQGIRPGRRGLNAARSRMLRTSPVPSRASMSAWDSCRMSTAENDLRARVWAQGHLWLAEHRGDSKPTPFPFLAGARGDPPRPHPGQAARRSAQAMRRARRHPPHIHFHKTQVFFSHREAAYCLLKLRAFGSLAEPSTSCPGPRGPKGQAKRFAMSRAELGQCVGVRPVAPRANARLSKHRRMAGRVLHVNDAG